MNNVVESVLGVIISALILAGVVVAVVPIV